MADVRTSEISDGGMDTVYAAVIGDSVDFGSRCVTEPAGDSFFISPVIDSYVQQQHAGWLPNARCSVFSNDSPDAEKAIRLASRVDFNFSALIDEELLDFKEPFRSNLHAFIVALSFYEDAVTESDRLYKTEVLFTRSLSEGPSFAKWIDGAKSYVLGVILDRMYFSRDLELTYAEELGDRAIELGRNTKFCVGNLYRANKLFNWDPPELDIKTVCSEPVTINENALQLFDRKLQEYLAKPKFDLIEFPDWQECLADSTTMTMINDHGKTKPNWQVGLMEPAGERQVTKICHVPRELKEKRAGTIDQPASALRVRWIERCVQAVIAPDKRNAQKSHPGTIRFKIEKLVTKKDLGWRQVRLKPNERRTTYCRDFKKEGLTKPRELLMLMVKRLAEKFPHCKAFLPEFYRNWTVLMEDGSIYFPSRGHGLGQAVALTTLMQLIIEECVVHLVGIQPHGSLYDNDDACLVFFNRLDAATYASADRQFCIQLSLAFKEKASFISTGHGVLCEQYVSAYHWSICGKTPYYIQEYGNLLCAANVAHAQNLASSMNLSNIPDWAPEKIFRYWGWVLFRNEQRLPKCCGGWHRASSHGCDSSFVSKDYNDRVGPNAIAAYWARIDTSRTPKPWDKTWVWSKRSKIFDRDFAEAAGIKLKNTAQSHFRDSANPEETKRSWDSYLFRLRRTFAERYRKVREWTWGRMYFEETKMHPTVDILPPYGVPECNVVYKFNDKDIELTNPFSTVDLLREQRVFLQDSGNEYILKCPSQDTKIPSADTIKSAKDAVFDWRNKYCKPRYEQRIYNFHSLPPEIALKKWHNAFNVAAAWQHLASPGKCCLPKKEPEERTALLAKRAAVYGRNLTVDDWIFLGKFHRQDLFFVRELSRKGITVDEDSVVSTVLRLFPGFGAWFRGFSPGKGPNFYICKLMRWHTYCLDEQVVPEDATVENWWTVPEILMLQHAHTEAEAEERLALEELQEQEMMYYPSEDDDLEQLDEDQDEDMLVFSYKVAGPEHLNFADADEDEYICEATSADGSVEGGSHFGDNSEDDDFDF